MFSKSKTTIIITILILVGTLLTSLTMIRSGRIYDFGLGFWGPNGHDAVWHLSVINQIKKQIPPLNPSFSGSTLQNYHWGFDFLTAFLSQAFHLNDFDLYFRILPIIFGILLGLLSYILVKNITKNSNIAFWFVFLNYFAGSFGWLVTLFRNKNIGGESLFWSMQSASTFLNPPYALSLIILLTGLILWHKKRQQNKIFWSILIGIIFGLLSGIKIYAAILTGLSFSFLWLIKFINKKANKFDLFLWISIAATSILILFGLNILSFNSLLIFQPFWFIHSMIESVDKLYLPQIASLRSNLSQQLFSYKLPFFIILELFFLFIFVIGNLGTRIFGFIEIIKKIYFQKTKNIDIFFFSFMFFAFLIPLFFVQKGTAWNTIQFFYYFIFFSNLYFAIFLNNIFQKKNIKYYALGIILIILTIPTTFSTLKDYFGYPPPSTIPKSELAALAFLKNQKDGIILTYPYDKYKKNNLNTPIPLYAYETTAYVSALTSKNTFLEDEMNLDITGFNWQERLKDINLFFKSDNLFYKRGFLINNNISYIYLVNDQNLPIPENDPQIIKIFENSNNRIYQVKR